MNYESIIKEYGTPLYIFDTEKLNNRIKYIRDRIDKSINLCYAMKANPFLVSYMSDDISRIEVCSPGEYEIVKKNNIKEEMLVISGVNKELKQIDEVIKTLNKEIITVESMHQFYMIKDLSKTYGKEVNLLIRLTSGNQFGVSLSELINIITSCQDEKLIKIKGIEYFSGTQKHSIKKISKELTYLKETIDMLDKEYNFKVLELEYGTGFPVFYFEGDEFEEDIFLSEFNNLLKEFKNIKITLEIGRSLVASCGEYLTSVVDTKKNDIGSFAILDGGIHQLVYYGSSLAMKTPVYEVSPKKGEGIESAWTLCGSLCSINDIIAKNVHVKNLEIGDTFIFKNAGAYSMTEGISLFLSRDLPKVILIENSNVKVLRDRVETYHLNTSN